MKGAKAKADAPKNKQMKKQLANNLLKIKAVELKPENPFTWASGIKSPIYCDNRKTLSFPEVRDLIKNQFAEHIKKQYPQAEVIAGVATGAIAHGVLVAEALGLPFVYVRAKAKDHGKQNQIEGYLPENAKVVVIEDLISTGGSSVAAIEALRKNNANVLGLVAIFSYGFDKAKEKFSQANCEFSTLTNFDTLVEVAVNENYIDKTHIEFISSWRKQFVSE